MKAAGSRGDEPPQNLPHPQQRAVGRFGPRAERAEGAGRAVATKSSPLRRPLRDVFGQREHDGAVSATALTVTRRISAWGG